MGVEFKMLMEFRDAHPEATLREIRPAFKKANARIVAFWHKTYLPGHFTRPAWHKYKYHLRLDRKDSNIGKRKIRLTGEVLPMVLTGTLRRAAINAIRITGTSTKARGTMPGTQIANFHQMRAQILAGVPSEEKRMAKEHEKFALAHINRIRGTKRKVIR